MKNIFAYTEIGQPYPQFVSINRWTGGDVTITVRSAPGVNPEGASVTASARLSEEEFNSLKAALREDG